MFFLFLGQTNRNDIYGFPNKGNDYINSEYLEYNDYFVYGESAWGEGAYSEFSENSITEFEENQPDFTIETSEDNLLKEDNLSECPNKRSDNSIIHPPGLKILKIVKFLYSDKTVKEIFSLTLNDWHEEYFEALFKRENWKAHWINVRYTYAFLAAMWQKSPIGDLIEFVCKLAK